MYMKTVIITILTSCVILCNTAHAQSDTTKSLQESKATDTTNIKAEYMAVENKKPLPADSVIKKVNPVNKPIKKNTTGQVFVAAGILSAVLTIGAFIVVYNDLNN